MLSQYKDKLTSMITFDAPTALAGIFTGTALAEAVETNHSLWAVVGSVLTVLLANVFKYLISRHREDRQTAVTVAEIAAAREEKILQVLTSAIHNKTTEKHAAINILNSALLQLQRVKDGSLHPDEVNVEKLLERSQNIHPTDK